MMIQRYFASLGIEVEKGSVKKVDKALDHIENRLKKLGAFANKPIVLNIGNFDVDQKKLNLALGNALDMASSRLVFEISKFSINQTALNQSVATAMMRAGASHPLRITPAVTPPHHVPGATVPRNRTTEAAIAGAAVGRARGMPSLFGPAIAVGLGGYGLGALNKRNQEIQAAQLTTEAVVTAGGMAPGSGAEAFGWLRNLANKTGFSYMGAADQYNSFLSNSLGMGKTLGEGQQMFKGISEYSRVMHVDPARQKLIFKAFTDMMGKGTVMSEELKKQLGNSLPGALSIFGEAYQTQTGGKLQGQDAITALFAAMGKGKLKSSELLPIVTKLMEQKAAPTIEHASHTSQSEQDRFKNMQDDMVKIANESGIEEGFARIFRTLNAGLSESGGLVRTLSEGFNDATKWADDLLLWPQSFIRALEGKDSVVADWLGKDDTDQLKQDWKDLKQIFTDISTIKFDFLPDLQATSKEVAAIMNAIAEFQRWKSGTSTNNTTEFGDIPEIDPFGFGSYKSPMGIFDAVINNTGVNLNRAKERQEAIYGDPGSIYYHSPTDYDDNQKNMAMDLAKEQANASIATTNQFDININIDPVTLANMDVKSQATELGNWFRGELEKASVNFPTKE